MTQLEEHFTSLGLRSLSREGRWLCSPRDPEREAADWVKRQKIQGSDRMAIVLGLGAGHHIIELQRQYPQLSLRIVELHPETMASTKSWLSANFTLQEKIIFFNEPTCAELSPIDHDIVLNFRPAWAGFESKYLAIYFQLTQSSVESFCQVSENHQLPLTSDSARSKAKDIRFALKDLDFADEDKASAEVKVWKTLRELIE